MNHNRKSKKKLSYLKICNQKSLKIMQLNNATKILIMQLNFLNDCDFKLKG